MCLETNLGLKKQRRIKFDSSLFSITNKKLKITANQILHFN
jgi:hypothetical protein